MAWCGVASAGGSRALLLATRDMHSCRSLKARIVMGRKPGERVMGLLEGRAEAISGELKPKSVANTLWAYATMGRQAGEQLTGLLERQAEALQPRRLGLRLHIHTHCRSIILTSSAHLEARPSLPLPQQNTFSQPENPLAHPLEGASPSSPTETTENVDTIETIETAKTAETVTTVDTVTTDNTIVMECGRLASFADGSVTVQMGNLVVLGTAVQKKTEAFYSGRTPLKVDYRERAVAVGRIAQTPTRREGAFTDAELRIASIVHRALSPLLRKDLSHDIQVLLTLLASDCEADSTTSCVNAAAAALLLTNALQAPVAAVRVAFLPGLALVVNPSLHQSKLAIAEVVYCGNGNGATMLSLSGREVAEEVCGQLLRKAHEQVCVIVAAQERLLAMRTEAAGDSWHADLSGGGGRAFMKQFASHVRPRANVVPTDNLIHQVRMLALPRLVEIFADTKSETENATGMCDKPSSRLRLEAMAQVEEDTEAILQGGAEPATREMVRRALGGMYGEALYGALNRRQQRPDSRAPLQPRRVEAEVEVLPVLHGSALVTLGETQVLASVALGPGDMAIVRNGYVLGEEAQGVIVSWEVPPFAHASTTFRSFMYGRMEVDRAELVRLAILPTLVPDAQSATVRVHCDVLACDGSAVMASVAASSLALMDAGVAVTAPAAGVTVGVLQPPEPLPADKDAVGGADALVVDVMGVEEEHASLCLHVAGTAAGITLVSLDLTSGAPLAVSAAEPSRASIESSISVAYKAVLSQLGCMTSVLSSARTSRRSDSCTLSVPFPPNIKRLLVGVRGATVSRLEQQTGCRISLQDGGVAVIVGKSPASTQQGAALLRAAVAEMVSAGEGDGGAAGGGVACEKRIVVPQGLRGRLIGRGGVEINKLEAESGARVDFKTDSDEVVVSGEGLAVDKALALLEARVAALQGGGGEGGAAAAGGDKHDKPGGFACEKRIMVQQHLRGRLIGRGGVEVAKLEAESGARVDFKTDSNEVVVSGERLAVDKALALLEARVAALQAEFSGTSPTSSQALASKYAQQSSALQKQMHGEKEKKIGVERLQAEVRTESRPGAANSPSSSPAANVQSSAAEKKIGVVLDSRGRGGFIGKAGSAIHVIEKLSACRIFVREGFILVTGADEATVKMGEELVRQRLEELQLHHHLLPAAPSPPQPERLVPPT